jgi:hypothetical protein
MCDVDVAARAQLSRRSAEGSTSLHSQMLVVLVVLVVLEPERLIRRIHLSQRPQQASARPRTQQPPDIRHPPHD